MRRILIAVVMVLVSLSANSQVFKFKKIQLGFQNSAAGLFTCDNLAPHFTHLILEENKNNSLLLSLYNEHLSQDPFVYEILSPRINNLNPKDFNVSSEIKHVSPYGPRWTKCSISIKGKTGLVKLEYASDQFDDRIYYIYTVKRTKSSSGLQRYNNYIKDLQYL